MIIGPQVKRPTLIEPESSGLGGVVPSLSAPLLSELVHAYTISPASGPQSVKPDGWGRRDLARSLS